jgi:O-antigen/teichoic acid export membrane protein
MKSRERLSRLSGEAAWIIAGQATGVIGQLLVVRALTSALSAEEYGRFALALAAASVVTQTAMAPSQGVIRFYSTAAERRELHGWASASLKIMAQSSAWVIAAGIAVAVALGLSGHGSWLPIALTCAGYCLVSGWGNAMNGVQVAARRRRLAAVHQGAEALLRAALAVVLLGLLGSFGTTAALAYLLAALVVAAARAVWFGSLLDGYPRQNTAGSQRDWQRQIWQFSWPFTVWGLFTWMQQASDRYAIEWFSDVSQVGLYAVVFQLGYTPATLASNALVSFVYPIVYQRVGDATDRNRVTESRRLLLILLGVSLAITVAATTAALLLHRQIFMLFAGPDFREYSQLLPWTVLAGGLFAAGQIASLRLMSENRTSALMAAKVAAACIGIGANITGAYIAGATGVVIALAFSSLAFLAVVLACVLIRRDPSETAPDALASSVHSETP